MAPLPPRYTPRRRLGNGGMAEVYVAFDETLRRDVAAKILSERFCDDPVMRGRFEREATLAGSLSGHPHVVTVHDAGEWDGRPYIVMELAGCGSVADLLRDGLPPERLALEWLGQAAAALDAAHSRGIVHRDVKPANLLVDDYGVVRITDFGIALDEDGTLTGSGEVLGTAGYLAPEQARGERCTAASDRYALAVVARELLTGRRDGIASAPAQRVLDRALATEPDDRYPTAAAFVEALTSALGSAAQTSATLVTTHHQSARVIHRARSRARRAATLAAVVVGAVAIAAVSALATHVFTLASGDAGAAASAPRATTCTTSPYDHDANVIVRGIRADAYCRKLTRLLTSDDEVWSYRAGRVIYAPDHGEVSPVCRFRDAGMRVAVYDSGSQEIGAGVCLSYSAGSLA
jgi:tRNA A-37 threonylcarbamoyl transferase component Bud32